MSNMVTHYGNTTNYWRAWADLHWDEYDDRVEYWINGGTQAVNYGFDISSGIDVSGWIDGTAGYGSGGMQSSYGGYEYTWHLNANPKKTTSLRLDATMKRRSRELLALHGMTLTEAFEEYMDELVYRGGPPMRASREAKANTMRIRFEAFMESGLGAGEEGEHPGEGGAR